ncbi:MAG TPA: DMT family transporter, partial [Pseudoneobacillus sp.]|nr:DMT family transporter [Pseudoneobacillus sp.]
MGSANIALPNPRIKGMALVLSGASLWGISGTVAQYLMQQQGFSPAWLVVVRLLISGTILLILASSKKGNTSIWGIWRNKQDVLNLLLFSILGMIAVQYTFFEAIKHSNAATATILQYLA